MMKTTMLDERKTPFGIICDTCGRDLPPSHFYLHFGNKDHGGFFITEKALHSNNTCFECAAPYRCLGCHKIKPASEFRIGGRFCKACKKARRMPEKRAQMGTYVSTMPTPIKRASITGDENG